jgi:hypothetical protein
MVKIKTVQNIQIQNILTWIKNSAMGTTNTKIHFYQEQNYRNGQILS